MKILWFSDAHLRGTTPKSRIDDYLKALEDKFDEIGKIIYEENVDLVLNGGDLFDSPSPSNSVITTFVKKMKKWGCPIYSIVGSHEKYGYNDATLYRTATGILEAAGITKLVTDPIIVGEEGVFICGNSHTYDLENDPKNYFMPKNENCTFQIQMVHGMLVPKPFFDKYTLLQDIETESDLVLCAHYHPGFGPTEVNGTIFVNVGSLGRTERTQRLYPPSVIIINTKSRNLSIINLKSAQPNVFHEKTEIVENFTDNVESFIELLKNRIGSLEMYSVKDLIIKVGEQEEISPNIIEKALKYVEEK